MNALHRLNWHFKVDGHHPTLHEIEMYVLAIIALTLLLSIIN